MTTQDKKQFVSRKIIEACPDILDLKFGCKVEIEGLEYLYLGNNPNRNINSIIAGNKDIEREDVERRHCLMDNNKFYCEKIVSEYSNDNSTNIEFKIIGRPIQLADVLIAMQEADTTYKGLFNITNMTMYEHIGYKLGDKLFFWHPKLNLDNQSDETINFLYELMK